MTIVRTQSQVEMLWSAIMEAKAEGGDSPTLRDQQWALAEAAVMDAYGLDPKNCYTQWGSGRLWFSPVDQSGRSVRLITRDGSPFRSWANTVRNVDLQVFVAVHHSVAEIQGWLSVERILQSPIIWWEENGKRKDFAYETSQAFLNPPPGVFNFVEPCPHVYVSERLPGEYGGVWNWSSEAWECFGCDRLVHSRFAREQEVSVSERHTLPEESKEPERPESIS